MLRIMFLFELDWVLGFVLALGCKLGMFSLNLRVTLALVLG